MFYVVIREELIINVSEEIYVTLLSKMCKIQMRFFVLIVGERINLWVRADLLMSTLIVPCILIYVYYII